MKMSIKLTQLHSKYPEEYEHTPKHTVILISRLILKLTCDKNH